MRQQTLFIRADSSVSMGTGHVMRCIALGQAWKERIGDVVFITASESTALLAKLDNEGFLVSIIRSPYPSPEDWEATRTLISGCKDAWVVLDGYHFDIHYHLKIRDAGARLLVIDDNAHLSFYSADIILNQNSYAPNIIYRCPDFTQLLLGTEYVLLRQEFLNWPRPSGNKLKKTTNILVSMGGSDPQNITILFIQALRLVKSANLNVHVVIGPENPHFDEIRKAAQYIKHNVTLQTDAADMPALMAWADFCMSAAGSTVWELAYMGVPAIVVAVAENQLKIAEWLQQVGAGISLGWHESVTTADLVQSIVDCSALVPEQVAQVYPVVDGKGAQRVVEGMYAYFLHSK